jgi:hypothetical protein
MFLNISVIDVGFDVMTMGWLPTMRFHHPLGRILLSSGNEIKEKWGVGLPTFEPGGDDDDDDDNDDDDDDDDNFLPNVEPLSHHVTPDWHRAGIACSLTPLVDGSLGNLGAHLLILLLWKRSHPSTISVSISTNGSEALQSRIAWSLA